MIQINGYDITMTRGDTAVLRFRVTGGGTQGMTAVLTVKKTQVCERPMLEMGAIVCDGAFVMRISPGDTACWPIGCYLWDVRLRDKLGDVYTPMECGTLTLVGNIGGGDACAT